MDLGLVQFFRHQSRHDQDFRKMHHDHEDQISNLVVHIKVQLVQFSVKNHRDLWIDLKDRLSQGNTPRSFELGKEIAHLAQGSLSVSSYFTKFKTLWDEYANYQPFTICTCACTCGSKSSQLNAHHKEHVFRFLMGLNDGYGHVIVRYC